MRYWQRRLKKFTEEKVLSNWRLKLAAVAAAFVVWSYVAGQQSMQSVYTVPVLYQNLVDDMEMHHQKVQKVQVTISGRRDRILSLKERQVWVAVDLSGMKKGRNRYVLKRDNIIVPGGIEVKAFTPKRLDIRLKAVKKEEVPK